jgi:hypothetical protein
VTTQTLSPLALDHIARAYKALDILDEIAKSQGSAIDTFTLREELAMFTSSHFDCETAIVAWAQEWSGYGYDCASYIGCLFTGQHTQAEAHLAHLMEAHRITCPQTCDSMECSAPASTCITVTGYDAITFNEPVIFITCPAHTLTRCASLVGVDGSLPSSFSVRPL